MTQASAQSAAVFPGILPSGLGKSPPTKSICVTMVHVMVGVVGFEDESSAGSLEGVAEVSIVVEVLGDTIDGNRDGTGLGDTVDGDRDGVEVGDTTGTELGEPVDGNSLGERDGQAEGDNVGDVLGDAVDGEPLGERDGTA